LKNKRQKTNIDNLTISMSDMIAERGNIERLLAIMGNLPEFLRLSFARRKVSELSSMSESDRRTTIGFAAHCLLALEPSMSTKLITTWIKAMCEIESTILVSLLQSYTVALLNNTNYINVHLETLVNAYQYLTQECQNKILVALKEALFLSPNPVNTVKMLPRDVRNIIGYED
jgi:hypothetical protein